MSDRQREAECEPPDEIELLEAEIATLTREREDWNGKHQLACIEIERLRAKVDEADAMTISVAKECQKLRSALEEIANGNSQSCIYCQENTNIARKALANEGEE